jgi:hypothetical protein
MESPTWFSTLQCATREPEHHHQQSDGDGVRIVAVAGNRADGERVLTTRST